MMRKLLSAEIPKKCKAGGNFDLFEELLADDFVDYTPQPRLQTRRVCGSSTATFPDFHAEIHWQLAAERYAQFCEDDHCRKNQKLFRKTSAQTVDQGARNFCDAANAMKSGHSSNQKEPWKLTI
jgi:hypothetical protein